MSQAPAFTSYLSASDFLFSQSLCFELQGKHTSDNLQRDELADLGEKVQVLVDHGLICRLKPSDVVRLLDVLASHIGLAEGVCIQEDESEKSERAQIIIVYAPSAKSKNIGEKIQLFREGSRKTSQPTVLSTRSMGDAIRLMAHKPPNYQNNQED